jgi:hypothetical protein
MPSTPVPGPRNPPEPQALPRRSDPWTDLALTLPIFVVYHLGVIFLPFRNAADPVTSELRALAKHSLPAYAALTLAIGVGLVGVLFAFGRRSALDPKRFALVGLEGALYAALMRLAGAYVVGSLRLAHAGADAGDDGGVLGSVMMALGAGFYEEVTFRVGIFGIGAALIRRVFGGALAWIGVVVWAVIEAGAFAAWHYTGALGDTWDMGSFVFRMVCGLVLTAIFALRGFAPAVWTHALYDVWVMIFE